MDWPKELLSPDELAALEGRYSAAFIRGEVHAGRLAAERGVGSRSRMFIAREAWQRWRENRTTAVQEQATRPMLSRGSVRDLPGASRYLQ